MVTTVEKDTQNIQVVLRDSESSQSILFTTKEDDTLLKLAFAILNKILIKTKLL